MNAIRYGVASAEDVAGMTGLEMLRAMMDRRLPAPPIAERLDFLLVEVEEGRAVFEGRPGPGLLNPLGIIHGGVALTLIDSAAGCAAHTTLGAGIGYTTVETKVNFVRAMRAGDGPVRAEGRVLSRGRQIITADARILSAEGKLVAHGSSTLIVLPPRGR